MDELLDSFFDAEELLPLARRLIQVPSENPPGNERHVALAIQEVLQHNGIASSLTWAGPGRPNLMAELEGSGPGPTLIYNGHLDVVPAGPNWTEDPFSGLIRNGRLYGRGAADMKSGVAAMIYAAIILKRMGTPFHGKLVLFFNADEENSNLGMKRFLQDEIKADYAVIGEPTGLDVCTSHRGAGRYRVHTYGGTGHTSIVDNGDNSIYRMAKLIPALEKLAAELRQRTHERVGRASLTVAQITGGTAPNIVPSHTVIEIDRRVVPGEQEEEVHRELERTIKDVAAREGFDAVLEPYLYVPPHHIHEEHILAQTALRLAGEVTGRDRRSGSFRATTEAPFFSHYKGIPTIIIGPGSLQQAHTADESVEIRQVVEASRVYIRLASELLNSGTKR